MEKQEFIKRALNGGVELENDLFYKVVATNGNEIELTEKLEQQLKDESRFNGTFISGIVFNKDQKIDSMSLPIYGRNDKYVTSHFSRSKEQAVLNDLKDRQMELLKRAIK